MVEAKGSAAAQQGLELWHELKVAHFVIGFISVHGRDGPMH